MYLSPTPSPIPSSTLSPAMAPTLAAHLAGVCRSTAAMTRRPAVLMLSERAQDLVSAGPCLSFPTDSKADGCPVVALAAVPSAHGEPWGLLALTDAARLPAGAGDWGLLRDAAEQVGVLLDRLERALTPHAA